MDANEEQAIRVIIKSELELLGIDAATGESRARTRSNFAFTDTLNNHAMRNNFQLLEQMNNPKFKEVLVTLSMMEPDRLKKNLDFLFEFVEQKKATSSGFRQGLASSMGEWIGRIFAAAVGMAAAWFAIGRH
jgi:hypothetical protein